MRTCRLLRLVGGSLYSDRCFLDLCRSSELGSLGSDGLEGRSDSDNLEGADNLDCSLSAVECWDGKYALVGG